MKVELVLDAKATIGESLLWVPQEKAMYWTDIKAPALYRMTLPGDVTKSWSVPADLGGFALDGKGRALVALRNGMQWLDLNSGQLSMITPPPFDNKVIRFNECICDSTGRFWVGGMNDPPPGVESDEKAMLYSFTKEEGLRPHLDFTHLSNGMAFSPDETELYIAHSGERKIYKFAYDKSNGTISSRRDFVALGDTPGLPDGGALDEEMHYWCAIYGAGRLHRYDPEGRLTDVVALPISQPTMVCFAGDDMDELYVSSARAKLSPEALAREPLAGAIFRLKPGVKGVRKNWRVN